MNYLKVYLTICFVSTLLVNCPTSPEIDVENGEYIATINSPTYPGYLFWPHNDKLFFVSDSGIFSVIPSSGEVQKVLDQERIPVSGVHEGPYIADASVVLREGRYELYYLADERETGFRYDKGGLYKLDEGAENPEKLLDDITHMQVSSDGSLIAYVRSGQEQFSDSLFIYDAETQKSRYLMKALPLKFSPDNEFLLLDAPEDKFQLSIINLSTGKNIPLEFSNNYLWQQKELAIRWDKNYPDLVFAEDRKGAGETRSAIKKWDGKTQTTESIWSLPKKESFGLTLPIAWSADRQHIAKWTDRCYKGFIFDCLQRRYSLHIVDCPMGSSEAAIRIRSEIITTTFSPDGSQLVYTVGHSSYDKTNFYLININ